MKSRWTGKNRNPDRAEKNTRHRNQGQPWDLRRGRSDHSQEVHACMRILLQCKRNHDLQGQEHLLRVPRWTEQAQLIRVHTAPGISPEFSFYVYVGGAGLFRCNAACRQPSSADNSTFFKKNKKNSKKYLTNRNLRDIIIKSLRVNNEWIWRYIPVG